MGSKFKHMDLNLYFWANLTFKCYSLTCSNSIECSFFINPTPSGCNGTYSFGQFFVVVIFSYVLCVVGGAQLVKPF